MDGSARRPIGVTSRPYTIVPLGTNGYFPTAGRQTMCVLVAAPGAALLLDAGSGVARLAEPDVRAHLAGVARLEIVLSHYHLDHVVGLSFLPGVLDGTPVRIHAPAPPLVAAGSEALDRLLAPPLFPVPLHRWPIEVDVAPYSAARLDLGAFALTTRAQKHPGGSVGLRLGNQLAYITDTVLDPATIDFARGVDTLMHEVWLDDAEAQQIDAGRAGHSSASGVADFARAAKVRRLVPVHHHPKRNETSQAALLETLRARSGCLVEMPVEGRALEA